MSGARKICVFGLTAGALFLSGVGLALAGTIVAWGDDSEFQLTDAPTGTNFKDVAGDGVTNLALRSDGSIYIWGYDGAWDPAESMILGVPTGSSYTAIAGNQWNGIALHSDGSIVTWGDDSYSQVTNTPTGTGFEAIAVDAGLGGFLALHSDGSIVGWGPDGVYTHPAATGFFAIALGWGGDSLALSSNGSIAAWGENNWGQVSNAPKGTGYKAIAANGSNDIAIKSDGSIVVWGYNGQYQVKVNGKWVTRYNPSLISLAPKGTGFTSLGVLGPKPGFGIGLAIHGP
jgi:hypothetical protein